MSLQPEIPNPTSQISNLKFNALPRGFHGMAIFCGVALTALALCGCHNEPPPPAAARVPGAYERRLSTDAPAKPLSDSSGQDLPSPPFNDQPLVSQQTPEGARFVEAYQKVGQPRILVWVSHAAGQYYDEAAARSIDYDAIDNILIDWLSAGGRVAVISPEAAHQALSPQQAQNLNNGDSGSGPEIAERLRADVLVMVHAQPTRQNSGGPTIRMVADASNLKGGESIGRAVVDVPPPLEKPQINTYTRYLARKLMADMTNSWTGFVANPPPVSEQTPPPATSPGPAR